MNKFFAATLFVALAGASSAFAVQPIDGSITSAARLEKAPIGSIVPHSFIGNDGNRYQETYVVQPDRSLKLVDRALQEDA